MDFYTIVLTIAVVLLILILTFVGIKMSSSKYNNQTNVPFPPVKSSCPDYWVVDGSYCVIPTNGRTNTGTIYNNNGDITLLPSSTYGYVSGNSYINFNDAMWGKMGKTTVCQQKDWTGKYNVVWDGVSNYNNC